MQDLNIKTLCHVHASRSSSCAECALRPAPKFSERSAFAVLRPRKAGPEKFLASKNQLAHTSNRYRKLGDFPGSELSTFGLHVPTDFFSHSSTPTSKQASGARDDARLDELASTTTRGANCLQGFLCWEGFLSTSMTAGRNPDAFKSIKEELSNVKQAIP